VTYVLIIVFGAYSFAVPNFSSEKTCETVGRQILTKLQRSVKPIDGVVFCQRTDKTDRPNVKIVDDGMTPSVDIVND